MPVPFSSCMTSPDGDDHDISVSEVTIPISDLPFDNVKVHSMRHHLALIVACQSTKTQSR